MTAARSTRSITVLLALLAAALLVAGCGGGEGAGPGGQSRDRDAVEETDAGDAVEEDEETVVEEPVPSDEAPAPGEESPMPPIQVTSPKGFANVHRAFVLAGTAQVHEGALVWAILDASGEPFVRGTATASCGAPCRGTFRTRVSLRGVPVGSWELHVWSPNVSDEGPERLHDAMVPISVTDRPVDAPEPDAPPPGGVPG